MTTIFLFHRDLRLEDNNGLLHASKLGNPVLPLFVFTPPQVSDKNVLRSLHSIQFMIASLEDLEDSITKDGGKLYVAYGHTDDIVRNLGKKIDISAIVECADYTPFAKQRTEAMQSLCETLGASYYSVDDIYLQPPGSIRTGTGKTFQKFTPFYEKALTYPVHAPQKKPKIDWYIMRGFGGTDLDTMKRRFVPTPNPAIAVQGGRKEALALLKKLPKNYATIHDIPSESTSMLSAHNHFGTVSIREVYAVAKSQKNDAFIRQLYWRDFYGHIMNDFGKLYGVGPFEFQSKTPEQSDKKKKAFADWCKGTTGIPLIDAGMRQLLQTGYMHNRVRLVVASWLVKDMGVHWRLGERFFAKHLVDYDVAQNMMNWIWCASVLPFASAPFRRIDAYRTAEKYDPDGKYVAQWLHGA